MANTSTNTEKKCNIFRKGCQLGLWTWCSIILCLISFPCASSSCQGVNISVAMYPQGIIYVNYGTPLEIFCVSEQGTADNLEFARASQSVVHSKLVNSTTRRLYIKKIGKGVHAYYCRNKDTGKICVTRVIVDSPPSDVTDFECTSYNLDELNCTWTAEERFSYTNYLLSFSISGHSSVPCIATKIGKRRSCSWTSTSIPRYKQMEDRYYFDLMACNHFGCNNQSFVIDHFSIVKPDAPDHLRVVRNDTHSVLLQWNIPKNMVDFLPCPVVHRIEYQIAKIDNTSHFRSVDASSLPPHNRTYKFWLSNLPYAHMQYEVRIYIKSALATEDKFWSDFTYVVFYTASERPRRPPDTITGAFNQALFDDKRVIYVYWRQLEEYEEADANFNYKIVAKQGTKNPQTLLPDKNKSLSYIILDDASLEAIDISIWSTNANGSSVNSSHLYIPSKRDTEALEVRSFTKLAYENGTYKLSWVGIENIDNYTLFWCYHNTTQICTGRMNFTVLDAKKNSHVIHLPTDSRYQFAISANKKTKTSGMIWASCDISKDLIPMYGFPVKLNHDAPGKSHVRITWTMSCTLQEGIITGYVITYCPVLDTSNLCDSSLENRSMLITDPKQMEVNITDLKPYRTYKFTLALNTTYGLKTIEGASTTITTLEDTPTSPRNVALSRVMSDALSISFDPPLHRNGILGKYVILNYGKEIKVLSVINTKHESKIFVPLTGLEYDNYSLSVQACNTAIGSCSEASPPNGLFVKRRVGSPSKMDPPFSKKNNRNALTWNPPKIPRGNIDLYQVMIVKDQKPPVIINTTNLSVDVTHCDGAEEEVYQVRAINFDEEPYASTPEKTGVTLPVRHNTRLEIPGDWSNPYTVLCIYKCQ